MTNSSGKRDLFPQDSISTILEKSSLTQEHEMLAGGKPWATFSVLEPERLSPPKHMRQRKILQSKIRELVPQERILSAKRGIRDHSIYIVITIF